MKVLTETVGFGKKVTVFETGLRAKPICRLGAGLLCYRKGSLILLTADGKTQHLADCVGGLKKTLGKIRFAERVLRLVPRTGIALSDHVALVAHKGRILHVDAESGTVRAEHCFCPGMSNPLCLVAVKDLEGFDDGIYYGEYHGNLNKDPVQIWYRPMTPDFGEDRWKQVYTFPAGSITHIHTIVPDPYRKGLLVLTGDSDSESAIHLFRNGWKEDEIVASGSQKSRSCVAFPTEDGVVFATDTPLEQNTLRFARYADHTWTVGDLCRLDGSCIYGIPFGEHYLFNTVVESGAKQKDLASLFTFRKGPGIVDRYTKVYLADQTGKADVLFRAKKDWLPMGLCQFGSITFCASEKPNEIWMYPTAVRKYDGRLLLLRMEEPIC